MTTKKGRTKVIVFLACLTSMVVGGNAVYELRLMQGNSESKFEGRVEIRVDDGDWGTICDTDWWTEESDAVCVKLGFAPGSQTYKRAHFEKGQSPVLFYSVQCITGMAFDDCKFVPTTSIQPCSYHREVGVRCNTGEGEGEEDGDNTSVGLTSIGLGTFGLLSVLMLFCGIKRHHRYPNRTQTVRQEPQFAQTPNYVDMPTIMTVDPCPAYSEISDTAPPESPSQFHNFPYNSDIIPPPLTTGEQSQLNGTYSSFHRQGSEEDRRRRDVIDPPLSSGDDPCVGDHMSIEETVPYTGEPPPPYTAPNVIAPPSDTSSVPPTYEESLDHRVA
ncbi:antigen WC1.1-like [Antedon mediterranea]|uniref:antigen WC1.1-like n=1 Tax=Antedon mediterranea TaxID=105859 RepID=UPI003AF804BD